MKYTQKKLPGSILELELTFSQEEFLKYFEPLYEKTIASVTIKGFRPGAAPRELAVKAVDRDQVFHQAISEAIQGEVGEIVKQNDWQLVDQTRVEVLESMPILKCKVTLTLFPEINLES